MNKYDVILDVYKTGSFSKTAQNLNYSQSAISQAIKAFEAEMGFPIFKRTNSGVKLIPAAKGVIQSLSIINQEQEKLKRISDAVTKSETGTVKLGLFFSFAVTYLPEILKDFKKLHPQIEFKIFTGNQDEISERLAQGDIDIAITSENSVLNFHYEKIIKDEFMAVMPVDHPLGISPSISIFDFSNLTYILSGEKFDYEIGQILSSVQIMPMYSLELYDEMVALRFIEAGYGVSIFSKFFLDSIPDYANVVIRPFKEHYYRYLVLATNQAHFISAASNVFLSFIKEWLKTANGDEE